jgi:predicted ATPase
MTERLIIRNFAGLEEVDIELGRVNIFIGPQASGKSICAKLFHFFKGVINEILYLAEDGQYITDLKKSLQDDFQSSFDITGVSKDFLVKYSVGQEFIQLKYQKEKLSASFSKYYSILFERYKLSVPNEIDLAQVFTDNLQKALIVKAESDLHPFAGSWQLFIPASRTFFAVVENYSSIELPNLTTDPHLSRFNRFYYSLRKAILRQQIPVDESIHKAVVKVLKASFVGTEKEQFLQQENGQRIKIQQSSSGQQEVLPLLLSLEYLSSKKGPSQKLVAYIEEPEAHLFPESQRALAQLMAQVYCQSEYPIQYVITTHSPYLLASFNNLIYSHQLAETLRDQPAKLKALYKVVPKNQQLALADVRVYGFENGRVKSLIDKETGLLSAGLLDSASDVTADQFGDLMALDPAIHS